MYLYFDREGTLKEIINDKPLRVGNSNWNKIYVYWEDTTPDINSVWIKYFLPDKTYYEQSGSIEIPYSHHYIPAGEASNKNCYVPVSEKRDLKFFKYYQPYEFYEFDVPDNVLALTGSIGITIAYIRDDEVVAMGHNAIQVDGTSSFLPDENISVAQWNELRKMVSVLKVYTAGTGITIEDTVIKTNNPETRLNKIKDNMGQSVNIITNENKSSYIPTEIRMNGASKGTSGVVDLGTVITSLPPVDQTYDGTSANAQSGKAVKSAVEGYHDSTKQDEIEDLDEIREGAEKGESALQPEDVVNNVTSTQTQKPLSAKMGKDLQDQITNLKSRGRYLSVWNATTGLAMTTPTSPLPYSYRAGDYFIVGVVGTTNYKPTGSSYTGVASSVQETSDLSPNDTYYYDGTNWTLLHLQAGLSEVTFASLVGDPDDNTNLASALDEIRDDVEEKASDVQINNVSVLDTNKVAKIPIATSDTLGVVKPANSGINVNSSGGLSTVKATDSDLVSKINDYNVVVPANLDKAIMEGLGNNSLTWTETYKQNARNKLGAGTSNFSGNYNDLTDKPTLFSGNYNDLTNKPTIPDELKDLTEDTTHRTVTDTEKSTWNAKSTFSGSYNDLTDKPTIPTVNNSVISIKQGNTVKGTFTLNQSDNQNIELDESGGPIEIVNSLPTATEAVYNEGKLYLTGNELYYCGKEVVSEPTVSNVSTLPTRRAETSAAVVGTDIYIFGGHLYSSGNKWYKDILKYNTLTNSLITMSATLPYIMSQTSAAVVGTNIYIFGGDSGDTSADGRKIYKYDTLLDSCSTVYSSMTYDMTGCSAVSINNYIYTVGGGSTGLKKMFKYDPLSNTVTQLGDVLPYKVTKAIVSSVGTNIYIFGGLKESSVTNEILKFDTITGVCSTISTTLPVPTAYTSAITIGTNIYIFGGSTTGGASNKILKFDTLSNSITELSTTLLTSKYYISAGVVGDNSYIFGGFDGSSYYNEITKISFDYNYNFNKIAISQQ